jgi:hypothetical protein
MDHAVNCCFCGQAVHHAFVDLGMSLLCRRRPHSIVMFAHAIATSPDVRWLRALIDSIVP